MGVAALIVCCIFSELWEHSGLSTPKTCPPTGLFFAQPRKPCKLNLSIDLLLFPNCLKEHPVGGQDAEWGRGKKWEIAALVIYFDFIGFFLQFRFNNSATIRIAVRNDAFTTGIDIL